MTDIIKELIELVNQYRVSDSGLTRLHAADIADILLKLPNVTISDDALLEWKE